MQPRKINRQAQRLALGENHLKFAQQSGRVAVVLGDAQPDHVFARDQGRGQIKRHGLIPTRHLGDGATIHRDGAAHVRREGERGARHGAPGGQGEGAPHPHLRQRAFLGSGKGGAHPVQRAQAEPALLGERPAGGRRRGVEPDPFRRPLRRIEQAQRPARRDAPGGGHARLIPDPDFPPARRAGNERAAGVDNVVGRRVRNPARVPAFPAILRERFGAGSHQYLPGGLAQPARRRIDGREFPRESRLALAQADRVGAIFAAEFAGGQTGSGLGHGHEQEKREPESQVHQGGASGEG